MSKFTSVFDTETKKSTFYIDDQEVSASDFSVGQYRTFTSCCDPTGPQSTKMCGYVSFTVGDDTNSSSYNFTAVEGEDIRSSVNTNTVLSRSVASVIDAFRASDRLIKILSKTESQTISIDQMLEDVRKLTNFNTTEEDMEDKQDTCPKDA